jgi:uncharacterized lipoprotein YbaY/heat shock protein HslJ
MRIMRWIFSLFVLALIAAPAATLAQGGAKVTGEVLYRERVALPPTAIVEVRLEDVSRADAPAVVIAEQIIRPAGKGPPYAFELPYDPATVGVGLSYSVRAEIRDGDKLLFTTTQRYPVITQGNPTSGVQIVVQMVGAVEPPASLPPEALDRDWSLRAIQRTTTNIANTTGVGMTIRFSADGKVSGSGGCNSFSGSYTVGVKQSITIANIAATLKACAPAATALEQEYFNALASAFSYTLDGSSRFELTYNNGQSKLVYAIAATGQQQCFAQTGYCVRGRFLTYWRQNGGLAVFGLPLSGEASEGGFNAQYFERQRFELHPENAAPYDVLLGRLGDELLKRQGVDWFTLAKADGPRAGCQYFAETQHNVCNQPAGHTFLIYWRTHGLEFDGKPGKSYQESLALFGLPLSEPRMETNTSGDTVLTQWFERARFEYHPNNPVNARVLLGRLGAEVRVSKTAPTN